MYVWLNYSYVCVLMLRFWFSGKSGQEWIIASVCFGKSITRAAEVPPFVYLPKRY